MKFNTNMVPLNDSLFEEWVGPRSRVGRRKKVPDKKRSQAAKRAWKVGGNQSSRRRAVRRFMKSPPAKRLKRHLARFNRKGRGRNALSDNFELIAPFVTIAIAEHISWIISQRDYAIYDEVFEMQEVMSLIIQSPDIFEEMLEEHND